MPDVEQTDLTALTVQLLSAYVSNNTVPSEQLAGLIETTRSALGGKTEPAPEPEPEFAPAVTVRKSLGSKDHILSLIDGKPYKTLKRHLKNHGLTPAEYRERYGLSKGYPMVAPAYSEARREVAQRLGLGQRGAARRAQIAAEATEAASPIAPIAPAPTKAPRVVKPRAAPKRTPKAKAAALEAAPAAEAPAEATAVIETPAKATRASKAKTAAKKTATTKATRAKAVPAESAAAVETPTPTPSEAPGPKARGRKPKAETASATPAPKRARKAPAAEAAPTEAVEPKAKRARKPKAAEPTA